MKPGLGFPLDQCKTKVSNTKILFLVKSLDEFRTQRKDVDYIIENLILRGYEVEIYDPMQRLHMKLNSKEKISFNMFPHWINRVKLLAFLINIICLILFFGKNKSKYKIIQINFLREEYLLIPKIISKSTDKLVITLFGSDINNRTFLKMVFKRIHYLADEITVSNPAFGESYLKLLNSASIREKLNVLVFPQVQFKYYKKHQIPYKQIAKKKLGIPLNKTAIIIGTNSTKNEQHERIIEQIKTLDKSYNLIFIFPLTNRFGVTSEREKKLIQLINDNFNNSEVLIINEFISYEKMAELRFASDILINLRLKDQFAASMLESNLSYTDIITGSWLPYAEYKKSTKIYSIGHIDELNNMIVNVLNKHKTKDVAHLELNRKSTVENYYTRALSDWLKFYERISTNEPL